MVPHPCCLQIVGMTGFLTGYLVVICDPKLFIGRVDRPDKRPEYR
jgi:hypothetical protein